MFECDICGEIRELLDLDDYVSSNARNVCSYCVADGWAGFDDADTEETE